MKARILTFCLMWIGCQAFAQKSATIHGRISDGTSFLPGVNVMVSPHEKGTSTDLEGRFTISNLPLGNAEVSFSFIGYESISMKMDLKEGRNELGMIQLPESSVQLADLVVMGTMVPSQMKAMSIKKASPAIMDVLAADAIGKLPDRNAAEAVQRLPAVSVNRYHGEANQVSVRGTPYGWTSTLYNGTRLPAANVFGGRNAILDAIPSEMIQYVLLSKALTPDMEGDAIGGSLNFVTRTAPEDRMLNMSLGGGFNQRSQRSTYNGSFIYGDRLLNNKLGFVISASVWDRNFAADEQALEYNINLPNPEQRYSVNTVNAKRYFGERRTRALNAALEYEFNQGQKLFFRLVRDRFEDIRPVYESYYEFDRRRYRFSYRYSEYLSDLNGYEIGGKHQLGSKLKLDWTVSRYDMQFRIETPPNMPEDQRGLPIAQFYQGLSGDFAARSNDGRIYNTFDSPDGNGIDIRNVNPGLTNPNDVMNPDRLFLTQLIIFKLDQRETDNVGQINLNYEANNKLNLKFGLKYRNKDFNNALTPLVFLPGAALGLPGSPPLRNLSSFNRGAYPQGEGLFKELNNPFSGIMLDPITKDELFNIFSQNFFAENGFLDFSPASNVTTAFHGFENVLAGYAMGTWNLTGKLSLTGGFRNEYTMLEVNGGSFNSTSGEASAVTERSEYNSLLPMINLKYSPIKNTNLRAAYTKTFIRPNFGNINPGEQVDVSGGIPRISRGNPSLQPTYSHNFDLMAETFLDDIGLLSAGLFYKNVTDFIFREQSVQRIGNVDYLVTQPNNLENAYLIGLEMGITKRFSKLPGFFNGFGVDGNMALIHSELLVPTPNSEGELIIENTQLPNQSSLLFNASIFYEKKGLMLRLAGNYRGKALETINQDLGSDFYVWVDKNFTVDFSGAYAITPRIRTFLEIRNLTNEPFVQYLGDNRNRQTSSEWFSISGQAGLRFNIF